MSEKIIRFNSNSVVSPIDDQESVKPVRYVETVKIDSQGEIVSHSVYRPKSQNGSGWVITYTDKVTELIKNVNQGATLRVFFFIALHQSHELGGYRCSRQYICDMLNLDRKTVYNSLEWLKDNFIVNETQIAGQREFLVNPEFVTVGSDKNKRRRLWSQRWEEYWKKKNAQFVVR